MRGRERGSRQCTTCAEWLIISGDRWRRAGTFTSHFDGWSSDGCEGWHNARARVPCRVPGGSPSGAGVAVLPRHASMDRVHRATRMRTGGAMGATYPTNTLSGRSVLRPISYGIVSATFSRGRCFPEAVPSLHFARSYKHCLAASPQGFRWNFSQSYLVWQGMNPGPSASKTEAFPPCCSPSELADGLTFGLLSVTDRQWFFKVSDKGVLPPTLLGRFFQGLLPTKRAPNSGCPDGNVSPQNVGNSRKTSDTR